MKAKTKSLSVPVLAKMFLNKEPIHEFIDNDKLERIANRIKADIHIAKCLYGRGFIADALFEAIEKRVNEVNP